MIQNSIRDQFYPLVEAHLTFQKATFSPSQKGHQQNHQEVVMCFSRLKSCHRKSKPSPTTNTGDKPLVLKEQKSNHQKSTSCWFQHVSTPLKHMSVKLDHFPKNRDEPFFLKPPPPFVIFLSSMTKSHGQQLVGFFSVKFVTYPTSVEEGWFFKSNRPRKDKVESRTIYKIGLIS